MLQKFLSRIRPLLTPIVAIALAVALTFGSASPALAAYAGGGRIGGGSFRTPTRTYSAPRSYSSPPMGGGYYPGGGIGFPFIFPLFGFGGGFGGLFSILIFLAVANFLVQSVRRVRDGNGEALVEGSTGTISVAKLQVGLLAEARELQADLNQLAQTADTSSATGLAEVLQETTLALLRHPEYWTHATATVEQTGLASAEVQFNRLALTERSKFSRETLSNVNSQIKQLAGTGAETASSLVPTTDPGEHIVVTLLVGAQGKLSLPKVTSDADLRQALQQLGGISGDRLLALEVLWTPQATGDVLSKQDLLVEYPELTLI